MLTFVAIVLMQTHRPAHVFAKGPQFDARTRKVSLEGKEVEVDVDAFMDRRLRERGPDDPATNQMQYVKHGSRLGARLLDFVAIGPRRALAIIAYSNLNWSYPLDVNHDLVIVEIRDRAELTLVRPVAIPEGGGPYGYGRRLFTSREEVLLRVATGFEVLDERGLTLRRLNVPGVTSLAGFNRKGELIGMFDRGELGITLFNLERRTFRSFTTKGERESFSLPKRVGDTLELKATSGVTFKVDVVTGKNSLEF